MLSLLCKGKNRKRYQGVRRLFFPSENKAGGLLTSAGISDYPEVLLWFYCRFLYHANDEFTAYFFRFTITFRLFTSWSLFTCRSVKVGIFN